MSDQTVPPTPAAAPVATQRRARRWSRVRWRRMVQIGCLPLTTIMAAGLVVSFSLLSYGAPPSWIGDPRTYIIAGRLGVSAAILFALQLVYHWINGLLAANAGAQAARGQGRSLRSRLRIVRRRFLVPVLATVLLRLGVVLVIVLVMLYAYTRVFGAPIDLSFPDWIERNRDEVLFAGAMLAVVIPYWLINPFLRVRFSTALGALAGTWSPRSDERTSLALSARLGVGLVGVLALLWGGAILFLIMLSVSNPASRYTYSPYRSYQPLSAAQLSLAALVIVAVLLAGQVMLTAMFTRLAQQRLGRPRATQRKRLAALVESGESEKPAVPDETDLTA